MKINRRQFLKALPAAALALTACGSGQQEAPATTDALVLDHAYPLDYARQFTADVYTDGSVLLTIAESGDKFLVRPEGAAELSVLPEGTVELRQPLENIYLVSSSMMDYFIHLDALDSIALSGTRADGWYLDEAKAAMEAGEITYAGKYSAPDYECILAAHCSLAIENTMIYHTPEVKEQLEHFGVPVLVERSSYESGPLARMEWIKFIGLLLGRAEEAERVFSEKIARIEPVLQQEPTGKTVAFFSVTGNLLITVRKGGDYVAQMIGMAGGSYVFADLTDNGNSLSTMNLPQEPFYAQARDADVLIYNSTIEGVVDTREQLVKKCAMLADFKAVQSGDCWCTSKSFFQQSMALPDLILDMNRVFTEAVGQRFADPAGRAGGPAGQGAGRALHGHHPAAAAPPGGHGDPAGGGALGSRLSAPDLFCQPHCGPVCHGHFQRCQAGRGPHHGDVPQSGALHQLGGAHHRRLCGCHGGDGLCAGCGPAGAADEHSGHLRRHDRLYLLCHHGHRGHFCAGLQHRQPPQLVHGQLFGRYLGQCAGGGLRGAARAGSLVLPMAAYQMGESYAKSVGVAVRPFSMALVLLSSLLAACVTAFAGPISFVGIAVPHLVKGALGSAKPLHVLPGCALGGAAFCLLCDLIARSLFAPTELSISSVTAVFGAPVVIWLLIRRQTQEGER